MKKTGIFVILFREEAEHAFVGAANHWPKKGKKGGEGKEKMRRPSPATFIIKREDGGPNERCRLIFAGSCNSKEKKVKKKQKDPYPLSPFGLKICSGWTSKGGGKRGVQKEKKRGTAKEQ